MTAATRVKIAVPRGFRNMLVEEYPRVFEDRAYARLLQELLFPEWRDRYTGKVVLSQSVLAHVEGVELQRGGKGNSGRSFLIRFRDETGVPIEWQEADWLRQKARTAWLTLPEELEVALSFVLGLEVDTDMVDFVTGRPTGLSQRKRQQAERRAARAAYDPGEGPNAPYIRLLNATPSNAFRQFDPFFEPAMSVTQNVSDAKKRHSYLRVLLVLRQRGLDPTYKGVERTLRIYTSGLSAAHLGGNIRSVLFGSALRFDLRAAQLAILARLWDLPMIDGLLRETTLDGKNPWPRLLSEVGLVTGDKGSFKRIIYATAYGMGQANLRKDAERLFGEDRAQQLFETPLMVELLQGREARRRRVRQEGGIMDAFGQWITLAERAGRKFKSPESSLMAHEVQSHELLVMKPALEEAEENEEFRIVLWLHDGLYAVVTQPERRARYADRVVRRVDEQAEAQGFATRLELADLSKPPYGVDPLEDEEE